MARGILLNESFLTVVLWRQWINSCCFFVINIFFIFSHITRHSIQNVLRVLMVKTVWRYGHIYRCSLKFCGRNPVISIWICAIGSFVQSCSSRLHWRSCEFVALTNRMLKMTSVWTVLHAWTIDFFCPQNVTQILPMWPKLLKCSIRLTCKLKYLEKSLKS